MEKLRSKITAAALAATLMFPAGTDFSGLGFGISISASAESTYGDFTYDVNADDTVTITEYIGSGGAVEIPSEIDGKTVTSIGEYAFSSCDSLTVVTIPGSVTSIGEYAFGFCSNLSGVTIPSGVTSIGKGAFYLCEKLSSVAIPAGVEIIEYDTFYGCTNLSSVTIPDSVTSIGNYAFFECTSLSSITIPGSVTSIGNYAFFECTSLSIVTIPENVNSIGYSAFSKCTNLSSVALPESVTKIGGWAFSECDSLTSVTIPANVGEIGYRAFSVCDSLTSIEVAQGNQNYRSVDGMLIDSTGMLITYPANKSGEAYTIPDGVTSIEECAFYGTKNLKSLTIPNGVTDLYGNCFSGSLSLENIIVSETNENYSSVDGVLFSKDKTVLIAYPNGKGTTSYTIPASVTEIGGSAFDKCTKLESVTFAENSQLNIIGEYAFDECTSLKSITIPASVTEIGYGAFYKCTSLESITIPASVTKIGNNAFYKCTSLKSITIPASVIKIGDSAFEDCDRLESVTFAENSQLEKIYEEAFYECTSLKSITIPASVTKIGEEAFYDCKSLESVTFEENSQLSKIRYSTFENCESLKSIIIPPSVEEIDEDAFDGCENLASIFYHEDTSEYDAIPYTTTEVLYTVDDGNAAITITYIGLGEYRTSVDIPSAICGKPVVAVDEEYWSKVGNHTHYFDSNDICGLCGAAALTSVSITIAAPQAAEALPTTASVATTGVAENPTITWKPADENAGYNTAYTASVTLSAESGYGFADSVAVTVNETAVESSKITYNDDGTITVEYTFAATAKRTPTSDDFTFAAPTDLVYNGKAKTATVTAKVSGIGDITVKYYDESGAQLDSAPVNVGTYTVKIDVAESELNAASDLTADEWKFTITKATPEVTAPTAKTDLVYTGTAQELITAGSTDFGTLLYSLDDTTYSEDIPTATNAGDYTVYYKVKGNDNVNDAAADSISVSIGKASVTITANSYTVKVGAALPAFDYTVTGLANGDTLAFTPVLTCEAADTKTVGTYAITVTIEITEDECYTYTTQNGTLTVKRKSSSGGGGGGGHRPYTPTEPKNPSIGGSTKSWSDIAADLAKLANGSEVTIELNGNTTVPVEVIKVIDDSDLKVTFVYDSVKNWKTDGAKISAPAAAELAIISINGLKTDALRGISGIQFTMNSTNIPTDLEIAFKAEHAGKFANLYKNVDGNLAFVTCAKIGEDGKVILPDVTEKGDYVAMLGEFSDRLGDMDNDGVPNAMDAIAILKSVVGLETGKNPLMADFNGDGKVNALDAAAILKRIFGLE